MDPENLTLNEDNLTSWLAEADEALRAGKAEKLASLQETSPHPQAQFQQDFAYLQKLRLALGGTCAAPIVAPLPAGTCLGRFQIRRLLGGGGFGVVYLAYDPQLQREVALKVPRPETLITPELRERFHREARAAAGLEHPNLIPVYEVGDLGPICFLVSAYCPGLNLAAWLKKRTEPVPYRQAAGLVATLAGALEYAHRQGVVHRDLKPANILLQRSEIPNPKSDHETQALSDFGFQISDFVPRITDFGLAKQMASGSATRNEHLTRSGTILGTASYMAPEQAGGKGREVGPGADIYALGAILYEILTGRPPFHGETDLETLLQVQTVDPVSLTRLRPGLPRDLETICLKCLQKEPAKRYASAGELAEDLHRFLADRPVLARRPTQAELAWRWGRRNPMVSSLAASVLGLLILLTVGSFLAAERFRADRDRESSAKRDARLELFRSYVAQVRAGRRSGLPGRRFDSLQTIMKAVRLQQDLQELQDQNTTLELRNEMIGCLTLADLQTGQTCPEYPPGTTCIAFDHRLQLYACAHQDGTIRVAQVQGEGEILSLRGRGGEVDRLSISPDGRFLAARTKSNQALQVWDLAHPELTPIDLKGKPATLLEFRPHHPQLAVAGADETFRLFDVPRRQWVKSWKVGVLQFIAFRPDGRQVALNLLGSPIVQVRDLETDEVVGQLRHSGPLLGVTWSSDGKLLALSCQEDRRVHVWDVSTGKERFSWVAHGGWDISMLAFHPSGDLLATSGYDASLRLWDLRSRQELFRMTADVAALIFGPDGQSLGYQHQGTDLGLWQVAPGREYRTLVAEPPPRLGGGWARGSISPDGRLLAMASSEGTRIWDVESGHELAVLAEGPTSAALFKPAPESPQSAREMLTFSRDEPYPGLYLWPIHPLADSSSRLQIGPRRRILPDKGESLAISREGRILAAAIWEQGAKFLRMEEPPIVGKLLAHPRTMDIAMSPDGRWAATATFRGRGLRVWNVKEERLEIPLGEEAEFDSVCFSPDGQWLAAGYKVAKSKHAYRFWQLPAWKPGLVVQGNIAGEGPIAFSPDGRMVALETAPARVRLLNPASGEEFATLEDPHLHRPRWMEFTPDGTRLVVSSSSPAMIHVWDLRLLRDQLAEVGLDWNLPPFPAPGSKDAPAPCEITVELTADLYELRGTNHVRRKEFAEARADFQEALKRDVKHAEASNSLAWLYATGPREMWNPTQALPLALQAVKAQPDNRNNQNTLGVVYYRLGRWDDAVGILRALCQANNRGHAAAWDLYFLAMSYQRLGKPLPGEGLLSKGPTHSKNCLPDFRRGCGTGAISRGGGYRVRVGPDSLTWPDGTNITDAGLQHLERLTRLEWLVLSRTRVSDAGMRHLQGLSRLITLDLHHTGITDSGLAYLEKLPELRALAIGGTKVSDAGLIHVQRLTTLLDVNLLDTKASPEGVQRLQIALPNAKIHHCQGGEDYSTEDAFNSFVAG